MFCLHYVNEPRGFTPKLTYQKIEYNVEMYWSLCGVSHLGLAKLVNCNEILRHVPDQDCIEFTDKW